MGSGFVIPEAPTKPRGRKKQQKEAAASGAITDAEEAGATAAMAPAVGDKLAVNDKRQRGPVGAGAQGKAARPSPKYLNSPETQLFKKGKNVFGLDLAKEVWVVERVRWRFI